MYFINILWAYYDDWNSFPFVDLAWMSVNRAHNSSTTTHAYLVFVKLCKKKDAELLREQIFQIYIISL